MRNICNCRVAVVGGAGFLGSHLVDHLIEDRGCRVVVVDNLVVGRREFVNLKAEFVHHDITTSEEYLRRVFDGVSHVFNYAAYPYVPDSFARPKKVCDVNFMGAVNVINAAQEAGVEAILQVSSAEIYGDGYHGDSINEEGHADGSIDESAPVSPHSSYGVAKAAVDYYVQCAWKERRTPCIALRQFNAYGPRETHWYVIPEIIAQIHCNGPVVQLGNNSTRDFQYAGDAVRCAVELLENGEFGSVYNLGSESGIKIYDLAQKIGQIMGHASVEIIVDEARKRPWEIWFLASDNSKINSVIKYKHQTSFDDGLRKTIDSFLTNNGRWGFE